MQASYRYCPIQRPESADAIQMTIAFYAGYQRALAIPASGRAMEYDWSELPPTMSAVWMPCSQMLSEFSRELANIINAFTNDILRLQAWAVVIAPLADMEKLEATREFVDAIAIHRASKIQVVQDELLSNPDQPRTAKAP